MIFKSCSLCTLIIFLSILKSQRLHAQIIVDNTKSSTSIVKNNTINIDRGRSKDDFLIHDFLRFDVPRNISVNFLNSKNKNLILNRITGSRISNVRGRITSSSNADILLINPNGIVFHEGARININGSLFLSTASSTDIQSNHLILNFKDNTSKVTIRGQGHNRIFPANSRIPNFFNGPTSEGLKVNSRNNISILAGKIVLNGGILTAPSGSIDLFAIKNGNAQIEGGIKARVRSLSSLTDGDVELINRSLVNASGIRKGFVTTKSNVLNISDASLILVENFSPTKSGLIDIQASNLRINGITETTPLFPLTLDSFVRGISSVGNEGSGPDIQIKADNISLINQGAISSNAEGNGDGGNIYLDVKNSIYIDGATPLNPFLPLGSLIGTISRGEGKAGDIFLKSKDLVLLNGGNLQSVPLSTGQGGNINVKVLNDTILRGFTEISNVPSIISTISVGNLSQEKSGDGGKLELESKRIFLEDGGRIDASTLADGNAGSIEIEAESIEIKGRIPNDESSQIISSSNIVNQFVTTGLNVNRPTGNSGSVLIKAADIKLSDSGSINVRSDGSSNAGVINIKANNIDISGEGNINASTNGGNGGNIFIDSDRLSLSNSSISSNAVDLGTGGNIKISSLLTALNQESNIDANAQNSRAGRVEIMAGALFISNGSNISATSQLGAQFNGSIEINPTQNQITFLNKQFVDNTPSQLTLDACSSDSSTLSQHGSGKHFRTIRDKQLYAEGLKQRLAIANQFTYTDSNGKEKPFRRWLGVQQKEDGELEMVFSPEQSKVLQNLLSSDTSRCINRS